MHSRIERLRLLNLGNNLEFEEAARLRDEIRRMEAAELGLNAPGVPQAIAQRYTSTTDDAGKARFPAGTPGAPTRKRPRRR